MPFSYNFQEWLTARNVKKLVVVLLNVDTGEVLERWEFNVEYEEEEEEDAKDKENDKGSEENATKGGMAGEGAKKVKSTSHKDVAKIKQEIRDVIRQITASVTFLPLLDCLCTFDVLIYTPE
jgi:mitotic spindle assembly checkpoint protein MAD2